MLPDVRFAFDLDARYTANHEHDFIVLSLFCFHEKSDTSARDFPQTNYYTRSTRFRTPRDFYAGYGTWGNTGNYANATQGLTPTPRQTFRTPFREIEQTGELTIKIGEDIR